MGQGELGEALAAEKKGDFESAIRVYSRVLEKSKNPGISKKLGLLYDALGCLDKAAKMLEFAVKKGLSDAIPLLALVEVKRLNFEKSIKLWELYGLSHSNSVALKNASILKMIVNKSPDHVCIPEVEFMDLPDISVSFSMEQATYLISNFFMAEKLLNVNLYNEALAMISFLNTLVPSSEVEFLFARALYGLKKYPVAVMHNNNVLMESIHDWEAWILLGNAYHAMRKKNAAENAYTVAKIFFRL